MIQLGSLGLTSFGSTTPGPGVKSFDLEYLGRQLAEWEPSVFTMTSIQTVSALSSAVEVLPKGTVMVPMESLVQLRSLETFI